MLVNSIVNSLFSPITRLVSETLVVGALLFAVSAASLLGTALAVLVIGITATFAMAVIHPRLRRLGATDQDALSGSLKVLSQTFDGIRDIRVFAREAFFTDAFWDQRESLARARYRARTYSKIPATHHRDVDFYSGDSAHCCHGNRQRGGQQPRTSWAVWVCGTADHAKYQQDHVLAQPHQARASCSGQRGPGSAHCRPGAISEQQSGGHKDFGFLDDQVLVFSVYE